MEEVLRSLQERGLLERHGEEIGLVRSERKIDVPDSVQDVLLGRLERLDPSSRDVMRVAAVIGREFPRRVLERVITDGQQAIDDRLRSLRSAELIHNARVWPEVVYVFRHALTQEVAYNAQTEAERQAQHARIGEAVEQVYADRLSEHFGVLAHHFTAAQRWDKALEYLLAAAQQAERTFATREALALYDDARRAAEQLAGGVGDPKTLIANSRGEGAAVLRHQRFRQSAAEGERILPLARLTGNGSRRPKRWPPSRGHRRGAATWMRPSAFPERRSRSAEQAGALAVQGRAHFTIGFVRGVTGILDESRASLDKAVAISSAAGDAVHRSLSLSTAGSAAETGR